MDRISCSNFIIVSGSGRKVGKTHLAVSLIKHFAPQASIIALKISPHKHDKLGNVLPIASSPGYRLFQELEVHEKNSGQFLKAGAISSFFLEAEDGFLSNAIQEFSNSCNPMNLPVICESGALGTLIRPGLMYYIEDTEEQANSNKESIKRLADIVLPARKFSAREVISNIYLKGNSWFTTSPL